MISWASSACSARWASADDDIRVECLEQRQQFVPDAVAREPRIGVRRILAEGLVERGEVCRGFGTGDGEEGAEQRGAQPPGAPSPKGEGGVLAPVSCLLAWRVGSGGSVSAQRSPAAPAIPFRE